ncbi:MAG: hypothetical protein ABIH66_13785 [bacterium]
MTINVTGDLIRVVRIGAVSLFLAIALFAAPLSAVENEGVAAATATATGTVDIGQKFEEEYNACLKAELTDKDLPTMLEYYSQYTAEAKAAVAQAGQCLAMLSRDDAACDMFNAVATGTGYNYRMELGATSTITIRATTETSKPGANRTFPADTEGCLALRKSAVMMQKAVTSPEACGKELLSYCRRDIASLVDPRDKTFACDSFTAFTCALLDLDTVDDCEAAMTAKFGKEPIVVTHCRNVLSGEAKGISSWMLIVWLGGALKDREWPILADDFNAEYLDLNPAYRIYAYAVKERNNCLLPITPALKSDICAGIAKYKAGVSNPDKEKPAGAAGPK